MTLSSVQLTFIFEIYDFLNIDLYQRGFYQIKLRLRIKDDRNLTQIHEPKRWHANSEKIKLNESISKSLIEKVEPPKEPFYHYLSSKVFHVQYNDEILKLHDVFEQSLTFTVPLDNLDEVLIKNEVFLDIELWFSDEPNEFKTSYYNLPEEDEKIQSILTKTKLVSERQYRVNFFPLRGLHYSTSVMYDYLHLCQSTVLIHSMITKIDLKIQDKNETVLNNEDYKCAALALLSARESLLEFWKDISNQLPKELQIKEPFNCAKRFKELFKEETESLEPTGRTKNYEKILKNLSQENRTLFNYICKIFVTRERATRYIHQRSESIRMKLNAEAFFFNESYLTERSKNELPQYEQIANVIRKSPYFNNIPNLPISLHQPSSELTHLSIIFEEIYQKYIPSPDVSPDLCLKKTESAIHPSKGSHKLSKSPISSFDHDDSNSKLSRELSSSSSYRSSGNVRMLLRKRNLFSMSKDRRDSFVAMDPQSNGVTLIGYRAEDQEFDFPDTKYSFGSYNERLGSILNPARRGFGSLSDMRLLPSSQSSRKDSSALNESRGSGPIYIEMRRKHLGDRLSSSVIDVNSQCDVEIRRSSFKGIGIRKSLKKMSDHIIHKRSSSNNKQTFNIGNKFSNQLSKIGSYSDIYNATRAQNSGDHVENSSTGTTQSPFINMQTLPTLNDDSERAGPPKDHVKASDSEIIETSQAQLLNRAPDQSGKSLSNSSSNFTDSLSLSDNDSDENNTKEPSIFTIMEMLKPQNNHIYMKKRDNVKKVLRTTREVRPLLNNDLASTPNYIDGKAIQKNSDQLVVSKNRLLEPISAKIFNFLAMKAELKTFLSFDQAVLKKQTFEYSGNLYSDYALLSSMYSDLLEKNKKSSNKNPHLLVFVHGLEGNYSDLRLVQTHLKLSLPDFDFEYLMSENNQENTFISIDVMGENLAAEVRSYIVEKMRRTPSKISFIGHSMGNLIIRSAIQSNLLVEYQDLFHTFLSLNGPHLGTSYCSSNLVTAGIWIMQKWKNSLSLRQLRLRDHENLRECHLYKMSQRGGFDQFKNVILVSSPQDKYAPYHSTRVEKTKEILRQNTPIGQVMSEMVDNILESILKSPKTNLVRLDIHHVVTSSSAESLIGRAAHIAVLDSNELLDRLFKISLRKYILN